MAVFGRWWLYFLNPTREMSQEKERGGSQTFLLTDRKTGNPREMNVFGCQHGRNDRLRRKARDILKIGWQSDSSCVLFITRATLVTHYLPLWAERQQYQAEREGSSRAKVRS